MAEGVQDGTKGPAVLQSDKGLAESVAPARGTRVGVGLVSVALILPLLAGYILLRITSINSIFAIGFSTVFLTSILLAIDAYRLGNVDPTGRRWPAAWVLFLAMCAVWILFYPDAFFRRRHFTRPNFGFSAILVVLFFVCGPLTKYAMTPQELPECDSLEVARLVELSLDKMAIADKIFSIDGFREIGYEFEPERRHGQCMAHTSEGDTKIDYSVEWRDRAAGAYELVIEPIGLPDCTSKEVLLLLEQVIRNAGVFGNIESIDGHREVKNDRAANLRYGHCLVHGDGGDKEVNYLVEWADPDRKKIKISLIP
jgi:hypothetical protein